jgi:hypothetical protein
MRWLGLLTLIVAAGAGLLWAADAKPPAEPPVKGFAVHEWGVFRVHDDVEWANADARAEWDGLPKFVYGQTAGRDFPRHLDNLRPIYKPVVFFHAPQAMRATVRVDFPRGVPAVWWPATASPAISYDDFQGPVERPVARPARSLEWRIDLKNLLRPEAINIVRRPLDKAHWMNKLRDVKADEVYVTVENLGPKVEREGFVYYDGLVPAVQALSVTIDKGSARLKNDAKFAVFDVWLVERRDGEKPRVARLPHLDAREVKDVELAAMKDADWTDDAATSLTTELKAAGLNEDEARSLVAVWKDDFFSSPGVTLLYRLPQEEYDRLLPLTVKPRPEKVVRVGLVQQVPYDKEMNERVRRLVKQLDDDDFDAREAAQKELEKLGRAAFGHLRSWQPKAVSLEAKRRVQAVLEKWDSQRTFR